MDAGAYITERGSLVDAALEAWLPPADREPCALHAAMRHLVFPGGKRLRPALALAACEAMGRPPQDAVPMAVAVELVHTYSLIHDDLPCMDDDDERRGRPAVHVAYGEATAVLAGDALLALAFEALAAGEASPERIGGAVRDLAHAAGPAQLVGGQAADLAVEAAADAPDAARIESVHLRKSAALIRASIVGGARLAGADEARLASLAAFGTEVGLAFQIADDVLDRDEDGACSLVRVLGLDAARTRASELLAAALARVEDLGERAEPLRALARFAVQRDC